MSETTVWIGIAVLGALIFLSKAKDLGEFWFLLFLLLVGGGYAAVLASAFFGMGLLWLAVLLTLLGMILGRASAKRGIPAVEWRARGAHATAMTGVFAALAFVTWVTAPATPGEAYRWIAAAYSVIAGWNALVAAHMAWWVFTNHDGKSTWNYGDSYNPDDDYGQYD